MVRTVAVTMMPSLHRVKKNRKRMRWLSLLTLLLIGALVFWQSAVSQIQLSNQWDVISHPLMARLLSTDINENSDIERGLLITSLFIVIGGLVGFWAGVYDNFSTNRHCDVKIMKPKTRVFVLPQ